MGFQCDRTAFLWHVRQRIAEWKRGGSAFCVLLIQVEQDEHVLKTQSQKAHDERAAFDDADPERGRAGNGLDRPL